MMKIFTPTLASIFFAGTLFAQEPVSLEDNFDSARPVWTQEGSWTVANNEAVSTGEGSSIAGSSEWQNYTAKVRLITDEPGEKSWNTAALAFRYMDKGNYYLAILHHGTGMLELAKMVNGKMQPGLAIAPTARKVTEWNELEATVADGHITIALNGAPLLDYTDPAPIKSGGIGLWNNIATQCRFSEVQVTGSAGSPQSAPVATQDPILLEDNFDTAQSFWTQEGNWTVENHEAVSTGEGSSTAGSSEWKNYTVSVRFLTDEPGEKSWNTAAIMFRYVDKGNHYLAILHQETGMLELAKLVNGKMQPGLAIAPTSRKVTEWNELQATVEDGHITISLNGEPLLDFTDPDPIMKGGIGLLNNAAKRCRFAKVLVTGRVTTARNPDWRRTIGVYSGAGQPSPTATAAIGALAAAGYRIKPVSPDEAEGITADSFFLYVIPDARTYPADGFAALGKYLADKGNLITIGGPAFTRPTYKITTGAQPVWYDKETYEAEINQTKAEQIAFDFESPLKWTLDASDPLETGGEMAAVDGGVKGRCLEYKIGEMNGWAIYSTPVAPGAFSGDHDLLTFQAKGDEQTNVMLLEFVEADGSRWLNTVPLTTGWKNYAVFADDFVYWQGNETKGKRGQSGDHLNPANAAQFKVGLARTHTAVGGGEHRFWIDELGGAKSPLPNPKQSKPQPNIETVSPKYKGYPLTGITALKAAPAQTIVDPSARFDVPDHLWSPFRRPQGLGYSRKNEWRWMPLVNAFAGDSPRGSVASLLIHNEGNAAGSICAVFGVDSLDDPMAKLIANTARRIENGLFLTEAGSQYFSYYPGETVKLGARVMNGSDDEKVVSVRMQVTAAGKTLWQEERPVIVKPHSSSNAEFAWPITGKEAFTVKTDLVSDGKSVDTIEQEVGILADPATKPSPEEFVTVKGSDFYCQGKPWHPYGVNYWPSYISGWDGDDYWGKWLAPGYYNPAGIEADLALMEQIGLNMVSIQMHANPANPNQMPGTPFIRNLLDFLRRCGEHHIKVNAFLPGACPITVSDTGDFNEPVMASYIKQANLSNNTALFAYDTIWEPGYRAFDESGRKNCNADWNKWIIERYGSAENAIKDWSYTPERSGAIINPPRNEQMNTDGDWRNYVAAYRRFMDDFTSKRWQTAHRKIKQHDPNHLISYRQGNTTPVDFGLTGPVKHLDFVSPEAYAFPCSDDGLNQAGFTTRYIHFTTGGKPVYWAEFGLSVWDKTTAQPDTRLLAEQGEYIRKFYKTALESGANGLAPWWWPGGYRSDEGSDYGIINPDGTLRPSAQAIQEYAPKLNADRPYPTSDEWFTIDRDANAVGYSYLTMSPGREAYQKARSAGKNLGIKTAGTGTDSANTPLIAVGNVPYTGSNPPKYLNAEFNRISIRSADGKWIDVVESGQTVEVATGQPVVMKASIGNLGEATWLAPGNHSGTGGVYLSSRTGDVSFREPILSDTAHLKDAETAEFTMSPGLDKKTEIVFEMTALDRMWFGEKFRVLRCRKWKARTGLMGAVRPQAPHRSPRQAFGGKAQRRYFVVRVS